MGRQQPQLHQRTPTLGQTNTRPRQIHLPTTRHQLPTQSHRSRPHHRMVRRWTRNHEQRTSSMRQLPQGQDISTREYQTVATPEGTLNQTPRPALTPTCLNTRGHRGGHTKQPGLTGTPPLTYHRIRPAEIHPRDRPEWGTTTTDGTPTGHTPTTHTTTTQQPHHTPQHNKHSTKNFRPTPGAHPSPHPLLPREMPLPLPRSEEGGHLPWRERVGGGVGPHGWGESFWLNVCCCVVCGVAVVLLLCAWLACRQCVCRLLCGTPPGSIPRVSFGCCVLVLVFGSW